MTGASPFVVFGDEWGIHPTSTQHLVHRLATNHPLLYVNTIGMRPPQLSLYDIRRSWNKIRSWTVTRQPEQVATSPIAVYSPFLLPFNRPSALRNWNRRRLVAGLRSELGRLRFAEPVLFVSSPIGAEVAGEIGERLLVYYITDNYPALPGVYRDYLEELEQTLLARADLVFVSSQALQREKLGQKTWPQLLPHGVDFEHFHRSADPLGAIPEELVRFPRPLLGFFGLLAPWVDTGLLQETAKAFPDASLILIGPAWSQSTPPSEPANLHWLGPRSYAELPRLAAHFDVGLVPFRQDRLTAYVNPLKVLEYMALGLPIVSTPLPDLDAFGDLILQASGPAQFVTQIRRALEDRSVARRQARFTRAALESWEARAAVIDERVSALLGPRKA